MTGLLDMVSTCAWHYGGAVMLSLLPPSLNRDVAFWGAQALKDVYYEPLARVMPSVAAILQGPPVMKLLFMTDARIVDAKLKPDWQVKLLTVTLVRVAKGFHTRTHQNSVCA